MLRVRDMELNLSSCFSVEPKPSNPKVLKLRTALRSRPQAPKPCCPIRAFETRTTLLSQRVLGTVVGDTFPNHNMAECRKPDSLLYNDYIGTMDPRDYKTV